MAEIGDKLGQVEVLAGLAKLQAAQGQFDQVRGLINSKLGEGGEFFYDTSTHKVHGRRI